MRKNLTATMTLLLVLGLIISMISIFVSTSTAADSPSQPTSFIEYSNAYGSATLNVPSIGNITRMLVTAVHQDKSSTIDNYEVLALVLSSSLTTGIVTASITTNFNAEDISWRKALRNGTSFYTEIDGNVTINNLLRVTANELRVQKTGNRLTVDFSPTTPAVITLPRNLFPSPNFTATWTLPAFHMDLDVNGSSTLGSSTTVNAISGWSEYNEYASSNANFTFTCPSWNNYNTSGTGTIRPFAVHRGQAPTTPIIPTDPMKTVDFYTGTGGATFDIPKTGNITRMVVSANHLEQGTIGNPDVIAITLSAAGFNGTVAGRFSTNPNPSSYVWLKKLFNGTSSYTEVNGNVVIDNIFQMSANEMKVQRNGTHITVDFNPATPKAITLPPAVFPSANFSATWIVPAFHMEVDGAGSPTVSSTRILLSGWTYTTDLVTYPTGTANATVTVPSWNFTTVPTTSTFVPYRVEISTSPYASKAPAASAFSSVTVLPGWTWNFFVHSNGGVGPHTYQWYEGTTLLQGQTSMVLTVTKTVPGTYTLYCKVVDAEGTTANSNTVTLTVLG